MSETTAASVYELIGGETGIRRLVRRFYDLMDTLPEAGACRAIHPPSLAGSEQKLFEYLSFWFGGPPLFVERHGPPMMRRRHFKAPIGAAEHDGWMLCFRQALAETVPDAALREAILPRVVTLAAHMRNRD
ncbi:group II truncated hemoglobin [Ancylobacter terrae]|uniref:group II truncated hemoglobin n=1 Tax=Ancylobacter sp. sgz301288 TaxID=3342077 RepID=UPI00385B6DD2